MGPPPGLNLGPCLGAQGLYGVFWDPHLTRSFWGPFGGTAVPPIGYYPPPIQSLWGYRCPHGVLGCPIGISGTPYRVFGPPLGSLQGLRVPMGFGPLPWGPFGLQGSRWGTGVPLCGVPPGLLTSLWGSAPPNHGVPIGFRSPYGAPGSHHAG